MNLSKLNVFIIYAGHLFCIEGEDVFYTKILSAKPLYGRRHDQ